jgi:hypothetical protein
VVNAVWELTWVFRPEEYEDRKWPRKRCDRRQGRLVLARPGHEHPQLGPVPPVPHHRRGAAADHTWQEACGKLLSDELLSRWTVLRMRRSG